MTQRSTSNPHAPFGLRRRGAFAVLALLGDGFSIACVAPPCICYRGARNQAHQAFTRALKAQQRPQAYYGLSVACAYLGEDDAQLRALEQAVQLAPTFALALRNLGALYLQKEDYSAAEKALLQSLQYGPNSALAYQHLGMLYSKLGQPERARTAFATARRLRSSGAALPGKPIGPN